MLKTTALALALSSFHDVHVVRIIDGDGLVVFLPEMPEIFTLMSVRLSGINTPETNSKFACHRKAAAKAKERLTSLIGAEKVDLVNCHGDKFWRMNCELKVHGVDAAEVLLSEGLATVYDGGKKAKYTCS